MTSEAHSSGQGAASIPSSDAVQFARVLNGCEYREEGDRSFWAEMKAAGCIAVFGGSDDLIYFAGAEDDELGAYDGSTFYLTPEGLLRNECEDEDCPHFRRLKLGAATIRARFDHAGYTWAYETDIPHATFDVMEDDEPYCRGIVFALADVVPTPINAAPGGYGADEIGGMHKEIRHD